MSGAHAIELTPFVDGLDHPEGVAWGPDGHVYAGGEAGQVYRVTLAGEVTQIGTTGGFLLGLCLDAAGRVYACDTVHRAVMRIAPDGACERYAGGDEHRQMVNPNWPVFAADGTLYVSDSGAWGGDDGCLWVVPPGGPAAVLRDDVRAFPNGMALAADGAWLYCIETRAQRVVRVAVAGAGSPGAVEEVVRLPERTVPDGLAFDAQGGLLISCYAPDVIYRLDPGGALDVVAEDWQRTTLAAPTNVAFCGPDLRTLVAASLGRWHLASGRAAIPGAPLHHPELAAVSSSPDSAP
jgi:gluconolactonase